MLDAGAAGLAGWEMQATYAVSPVLDVALLESWPESHSGWDEWYFFRNIPGGLALPAVCNYGGTSLADASMLKGLPEGPDLPAQLDCHMPEAVVGDGQRIFFIARERALVDKFVALCERRRTKRRLSGAAGE
jgi:hypothetical protein